MDKTDNSYRVMYIIAYLVPLISGVIVFVIYYKKDKRLEFHAIQSVVYWLVFAIFLYLLEFVGTAISMLAFVLVIIDILYVLGWLYAVYVGYSAMLEKEKDIPFITDLSKSVNDWIKNYIKQ